MTSADLIVVIGGIAAIAWVNWYFFLAGRSASTRGEPTAAETAREAERSGR